MFSFHFSFIFTIELVWLANYTQVELIVTGEVGEQTCFIGFSLKNYKYYRPIEGANIHHTKLNCLIFQ
jgi:hypothetical protein